MTTTTQTASLGDRVDTPIQTTAAEDAGLASKQQEISAWNRLIDHYLVEWGRHPEQLADEDFVPPSRPVIDRACQLAMQMRDNGFAAALRVVPDGEGGVCFERIEGNLFFSLRVEPGRPVERLVFENHRLVLRELIV